MTIYAFIIFISSFYYGGAKRFRTSGIIRTLPFDHKQAPVSSDSRKDTLPLEKSRRNTPPSGEKDVSFR
jgi:hypothetical protein